MHLNSPVSFSHGSLYLSQRHNELIDKGRRERKWPLEAKTRKLMARPREAHHHQWLPFLFIVQIFGVDLHNR